MRVDVESMTRIILFSDLYVLNPRQGPLDRHIGAHFADGELSCEFGDQQNPSTYDNTMAVLIY